MTETSIARRSVIGAGWLIAWRMVARGLGFVSTLVLARLLVPVDFGLVAMATAFAGAVDALSQFGVEDMLVRRAEDDTRLHDAAFTLQAGRALLTGGLIVLAAPAAARWFDEPRLIPVLMVLGVLSGVAGFENIGMVGFRRDLRYDVQFRVSLIPRLLQLVATIVVAWTTHSYWALLVGMATMRVVRLVMTYVVHPYRPRFSLSGWRELAGFSFWLWAASLARLVWDRYEPFVIGPKFGPASLGLYQIAALVAALPVSEFVAPAADVLLAGFSLAQRSGSRATQEALPAGLALLLLLAPVGLAMSAGAGDVVRLLLGTKWAAAGPLISIFALYCLWAPIGYVCRAVMVATGKVKREFIVMLVMAAIKVLAITAAARTHGLIFVAGASVACSAIETLLFMAQVGPVGGSAGRRALGGFVRVALGGLVAGLALAQTGMGWVSLDLLRGGGSAGIGVALLHLIVLGIVAVVACWGTVGGLWLAAGRPQGPETLLSRVAGQFLRPCLAWVRGTV